MVGSDLSGGPYRTSRVSVWWAVILVVGLTGPAESACGGQ